MADPLYNVPEDYKSGLADILKEAKNIYEAKKGAGYQTYTGEQIAGFSPDELAAMQGIAGLVGKGQEYFKPAEQIMYGQLERFTPDTAQQYMSPYQQAVVDVEKREARRQAERTMQDIGAGAVSKGGFGGSRQAILEAETGRNLQQQLGDIQTRGSQAAFETGLRSFEAQKERERAAASGLSSLGQAAPRQALTELTALSGIGEAQRGMTQAGLDIARSEFERQQQYPYDLLGQYQSTLYGYPYQSTQQYQPYEQKAKASSAQQLAGLLGAGAKAYGSGMFSSFGFNSGGRIAYNSEGGLSGVIKTLANGGTAGSEDSPLDALMASMLGVQTARQETAQKEAELAAEKEARLQKQMSPASMLGDLLIGYAAADPEAGFGVQLAGATTYAAEQRQAAQDAIDTIKSDLAEGKIDQATADLEMAKLTYEYSLPPSIKFPSDTEMRATAEGYLNTMAEAKTTEGAKKINNAIINAKRRMREEAAENPQKYKDRPSAQEIRINELISEEMTGKPAIVDATSVSGNVATDETAQQPAVPLAQQIDKI